MSRSTSQNKPPISVLMSVYNGERWLNEAIQSVLNQTLTDFEFVIVNDGSKDRSLEIINQFALRDHRIVVVDKPNTGLADSLNQGIKQARGDWIARIDADDLCASERIQKQYALAQTNSNLVLIGSGLMEIDEAGQPGKVYLYPTSHADILNRLTTVRSVFPHSSVFYKTEVVRKMGGYRLRIKRAEDWDLWLRFSETGKISCVDEPLVKVRKHTNQISHDEQGRRQIIDSRVAMTSYWLRQYGFIDPVSTECSDKDFEIFRMWVTRCLQEYRLFEYRDFIQMIKEQLNSNRKPFSRYLRLVMLLLQEPIFVIRYFHQSLVGERLQKKMAAKWIKQNQNQTQYL